MKLSAELDFHLRSSTHLSILSHQIQKYVEGVSFQKSESYMTVDSLSFVFIFWKSLFFINLFGHACCFMSVCFKSYRISAEHLIDNDELAEIPDHGGFND